MPNQKVFCNVPWTNLHIYWDGSFGACCSERGKPYSLADATTYNIKNMSVSEWFDSGPMQTVRQQMFGDSAVKICAKCYEEESVGYESRRIKENFKSVIFTEQAFTRSFETSPLKPAFKQDGGTDLKPIDWHVDLGNECNLACKMCKPDASSKIAAQYRRWKIIDADQSIFENWTADPVAWNRFVDSIESTPNLNRIHFMGGEPLMNKRFEPLLEHLIDTGQAKSLSISFVTNGTIYRQSIIDKLKQFKSCDIEVSIESFDRNNDYIRQGSEVDETLANIDKILKQTDDQLHLVLRSVPQLLNVNTYHNYLSWCLDNNVPVQGIPLANPPYLKISVLPWSIREQLIKNYIPLKEQLEALTSAGAKSIATGRDPSRIPQQLLRETNAVISLLYAKSDTNVEQQRQELVYWLKRWDEVYQLDAKEYYPEYLEFLVSYGY